MKDEFQEDIAAGKIGPSTFERVIEPRLGARRDEILTGPRHGVDVGVIAVGSQAMAITTDPFYVVPEFGWERAIWFAIHIVASDAATSGLPLAYLSLDLNLPPDLGEDALSAMWMEIDRVCQDLGIAIIAGHTGRYEDCRFPMIGGATVMAVGAAEAWVTAAMARPGDAVLVTKGPAIETTAVFGVLCAAQIRRQLGDEVAQAAAELFWQMSVVRDAGIAASTGLRDLGVTAMHDAAERGLWGALYEMADASGVGLRIAKEEIPVHPAVRAVCDLYKIDPFTASSQGTLILTCRPGHVGRVLSRLREAGIAAARIGDVTAGDTVRVVQAGQEVALPRPRSDPFWPALQAALQEGSP